MADELEDESVLDYESISILIPKSRKGDQVARDQLLIQMQDYLNLMANKYLDRTLQQKVGSADIVQQALTQVIQNFGSFRGTTSAEFRGWLKTIVVNEMGKVRRQFRAGKRDVGKEQNIDGLSSAAKNFNMPKDDNRTPSSEAINNEQIENFYEVLDLLPEHYRQVIRLRSIEEMSFKEIGEIMERSGDSATKLFQRAVIRFGEELKKTGEFNSDI